MIGLIIATKTSLTALVVCKLTARLKGILPPYLVTLSKKHLVWGGAMPKNAGLVWGLFCLRIGLGLFLALWGIDKMVVAELNVHIFATTYLVTLNPSVMIILGAVELVVSLLFILGVHKSLTYGAGFLLQGISTVANFHYLLYPFGEHHHYIAEIPLLLAFMALFLMRDLDNKWTLGKKKSLFS